MDEGLPLRPHGDEGGGVDVRAVLPEGGVLGGEGGEPRLERLRVEVASLREGEEGEGEPLVLAPGVDDARGSQARRGGLDDPGLAGRGELRVAAEELQDVGGVGGGVDPAGAGDEAAGVLLGDEVPGRGGEEVLERLLRRPGGLQVDGGEDREGEGREGAPVARVGPLSPSPFARPS